jgi:hypothetical protein
MNWVWGGNNLIVLTKQFPIASSETSNILQFLDQHKINEIFGVQFEEL